MPNRNKITTQQPHEGTLTRMGPMDTITQWEREMERMFDDFWRRPFRSHLRSAGIIQAPPIDVFQDQNNVTIKAELPGMTKEDIHVSVQGSTLTIKGEKKREKEVKEEDYYRSECSYGGFSRTVELPSEVNFEKADAAFKDGVLEIKLPKTEEAKDKTKNIPIH